MCYKSPWGRGREKRRPSTLAGGPWRRPVDIKLGRNYLRAPHDQGSDRPATKDCSPYLQRTKIHYFSAILCSLRLRGLSAGGSGRARFSAHFLEIERVAAGTKDPHTERSAEPTDIAPNSAGAHDACSLAFQ